jgi:hypothetical protein
MGPAARRGIAAQPTGCSRLDASVAENLVGTGPPLQQASLACLNRVLLSTPLSLAER